MIVSLLSQLKIFSGDIPQEEMVSWRENFDRLSISFLRSDIYYSSPLYDSNTGNPIKL